jgi:hypothetical protein
VIPYPLFVSSPGLMIYIFLGGMLSCFSAGSFYSQCEISFVIKFNLIVSDCRNLWIHWTIIPSDLLALLVIYGKSLELNRINPFLYSCNNLSNCNTMLFYLICYSFHLYGYMINLFKHFLIDFPSEIFFVFIISYLLFLLEDKTSHNLIYWKSLNNFYHLNRNFILLNFLISNFSFE